MSNKIHSIQELNTRVWFRLLKVVSVCVLLFVIAASYYLFIIHQNGLAINYDDSTIRCGSGKSSTLVDAKISSDEIFSRLYNGQLHVDDTSILTHCNFSFRDETESRRLMTDCLLSSELTDSECFDKHRLYNLSIITQPRWLNISLAFLGLPLIWILLFRIFARIFYYIVLGRFNPPKNSTTQKT
ncbi:MAG: hypothetical protein WCO25_01285 [Candidatus Uhrbacteria bacterium]